MPVKGSQSITRATNNKTLSRDSHIAMHQQLAQHLRAAITQGVYKPGDRLPTEPELMERFEVSRITARQAVAHLVQEGRVVRKQGKGTFVAPPVLHHDLLDMRGIYDEMVAQGLRPATRLLEFAEVMPPSRVAERLNTGKRRLVHWKRFYQVEGKPFGISVVHLNPGDVCVTKAQASRYPTYSLLESVLGLHIERADIAIRYQRASAEIVELLGVRRGTPVMMLERVSYSSDGIPREHSLYYAKGDNYEFRLTVRGKLPITAGFKEPVN